jgi:hypothetical protein
MGYFDDPDPFEALAEARAEVERLRAALATLERAATRYWDGDDADGSELTEARYAARDLLK